MIDYTDAQRLVLRLAQTSARPSLAELAITAHPNGVQEKDVEIIVKKGGTSNSDHRDRRHYDTMIAEAFAEMHRVVVRRRRRHDRVRAWGARGMATAARRDRQRWASTHRRLASEDRTWRKGRVLQHRDHADDGLPPAPADRPVGRKGAVEAEIQARDQAPLPRLGALGSRARGHAHGGRRARHGGRRPIQRGPRLAGRAGRHPYLPAPRPSCGVQEAMAVEIDHRPLETFDARTRFALWWVRLYGRQPQPKSELRWQALASSLDIERIRDLIPGEKTRFAMHRQSSRRRSRPNPP